RLPDAAELGVTPNRGRITGFAYHIPEKERPIMDSVNPRHSIEEFVRRGDALYEQIRPKLVAKDKGKFLAIDIETGEYEISVNEMRAGNKLRARLPEAQIWMVRIGYPAARSFGGRQVRQESP